MTASFACAACGAKQDHNTIRCEQCGKPLVFASFTCPRCGAVSYNPNDAANRYCGRCHVFVEDAMNEARITRTPVNHCVNCGKKIDSAAPTPDYPDGSAPRPGDVAICLDCVHVHIYADDLTLRNPTEAELVDIAGDPDIVRAVNQLGMFNRQHPR